MQSKNQKREQAPLLVAAWRALTPAEQVASLNARLGVGQGAKRQRAKLSAILNPVTPTTPVEAPPNGGEPGAGLTDTPVKKKKFKKGNRQ